jgi:hypothetical protein
MQIGFIGDPPDKLKLALFSDADFAGDRNDLKSTSGVFLALNPLYRILLSTYISDKGRQGPRTLQ